MRRIINALSFRVKNAGQKLSFFAKPFLFRLIPAKVECNICGWRDTAFKTDGWHPRTVCPNCSSGIRQRLFWACISQSPELNMDKLLKNKKVLHVAPDECLASRIKCLSNGYVTADLLTEGYEYPNIDLNIDLSNMKEIGDGEFDAVIAFDVLEHIPNHLAAIAETARVLKQGGVCVFTVPQKDGLMETIEDITLTDPKERERRFGQADHFRIYGADFKDMIQQNGFRVVVIDKSGFDEFVVRRNVLHPPVLSDHPLATNERKVYFGVKI